MRLLRIILEGLLVAVIAALVAYEFRHHERVVRGLLYRWTPFHSHPSRHQTAHDDHQTDLAHRSDLGTKGEDPLERSG